MSYNVLGAADWSDYNANSTRSLLGYMNNIQSYIHYTTPLGSSLASTHLVDSVLSEIPLYSQTRILR